MSSQTVVKNVQDFLEAEGLIGGSTGWGSYRRRKSDEGGDKQVVISEDGGREPEIPSSSGLGDSAFKDPAVQVLVRGQPWKGDDASDKAGAIWSALHGKSGALVSGQTEYLRVVARTSSPIFVGFDELGRPEFTVSFRLLALV